MPDDNVESNLIIERLNAKDELTYQRGDTLDVKGQHRFGSGDFPGRTVRRFAR
jgi:hypothetical protein